MLERLSCSYLGIFQTSFLIGFIQPFYTLAKAFKNVRPPEVLFHSGWQAPKISQLREQLKMLSSQRSESHGVAV